MFQELIEKLKKSSYILQKWNEKKLEDIQQKKKEQNELLQKKYMEEVMKEKEKTKNSEKA